MACFEAGWLERWAIRDITPEVGRSPNTSGGTERDETLRRFPDSWDPPRARRRRLEDATDRAQHFRVTEEVPVAAVLDDHDLRPAAAGTGTKTSSVARMANSRDGRRLE
jgi:hypothetical protein